MGPNFKNPKRFAKLKEHKKTIVKANAALNIKQIWVYRY